MNVHTNLNVTNLNILNAEISSANMTHLSVSGEEVASKEYVKQQVDFKSNVLSGMTFDYQNIKGLYESVSAVVYAFGGQIQNFPTFS